MPFPSGLSGFKAGALDKLDPSPHMNYDGLENDQLAQERYDEQDAGRQGTKDDVLDLENEDEEGYGVFELPEGMERLSEEKVKELVEMHRYNELSGPDLLQVIMYLSEKEYDVQQAAAKYIFHTGDDTDMCAISKIEDVEEGSILWNADPVSKGDSKLSIKDPRVIQSAGGPILNKMRPKIYFGTRHGRTMAFEIFSIAPHMKQRLLDQLIRIGVIAIIINDGDKLPSFCKGWTKVLRYTGNQMKAPAMVALIPTRITITKHTRVSRTSLHYEDFDKLLTLHHLFIDPMERTFRARAKKLRQEKINRQRNQPRLPAPSDSPPPSVPAFAAPMPTASDRNVLARITETNNPNATASPINGQAAAQYTKLPLDRTEDVRKVDRPPPKIRGHGERGPLTSAMSAMDHLDPKFSETPELPVLQAGSRGPLGSTSGNSQPQSAVGEQRGDRAGDGHRSGRKRKVEDEQPPADAESDATIDRKRGRFDKRREDRRGKKYEEKGKDEETEERGDGRRKRDKAKDLFNKVTGRK